MPDIGGRLVPVQTLMDAEAPGCPPYGTKETLIVRLLAQRELRFKLARGRL
jgi:hypothetical protein